MPPTERTLNNIQHRFIAVFVIIGILLLILVLRLWSLQVNRHDYYMTLSEQNRLRDVFVPAPRGNISDRNGKVLATNRPSFNVEFVAEDCPTPEETITRLAEIVGVEPALLLTRSKQLGKRRRFEPRILLRDVSRDLVAKVSAHTFELPGVVVNVVPTRNYLYGEFAAHVLGYIREITKVQLDLPKYAGYVLGDMVGQYGLESRWERELQGRRGVQRVVVNATGTRIGEASFDPDVAGKNLQLTIDFAMQRAADDALQGKKGAVVALDARTGEILAMASHPGFDPNVFAGELDSKIWRDLVSGPEKKLSNRAVQGAFPPGSVFKVFMAIAALAEGVIGEKDRISCPGYLFFGGRNFRCHKKTGHGPVNLFEALVQSCDVYFYTVGNRLGIDRIYEYATRFGLGSSTKLELTDESRGLIPSTEWKRRYNKRNPANQKWFPGETLSVVIGQGAVLTTPLQIARAMAALVNGGNVLVPYLVKGIESEDGEYKDENFGPQVISNIEIDPKIVNTVIDALVGVVADPRGTGKRAKLDGVPLPKATPVPSGVEGASAVAVAAPVPQAARSVPPQEGFLYPPVTVGGKTGTSQVISLDSRNRRAHHEDHAWFAGFAPAQSPEIVVVALIENGGHGGVAAAPVVQKVMAAYFYPEQAIVTNESGKAVESGRTFED